MMRRRTFAPVLLALGAAVLAVAALPAPAQQGSDADAQLREYREMLAEDNPADLTAARGEELWKTRRGPRNASLERCDLGLGAGVVKGAYAQLPRYFADTDKVMDLEQRLIYCMVNLQGMNAAEITRRPFGSPEHKSDFEALVAWIASESKGMKVNVSTANPKEMEAYLVGEQMFYRRAGPYDFACATCHSEQGKRIRLQDLPDLATPAGAGASWTTWPAYRVSQGEVRTMQHRLFDCYRQMRHPQAAYASDGLTALQMYLAKTANGAIMNAPAVKR